MIAGAMLWMAATAALLALAARALEDVLRSYALPTRWVWVAALVGSAALPIVAFATDGRFPGGLLPRTAESIDIAELFASGDVIVVESSSAGAANARGVLVERALGLAWPAASMLALLLYGATWLRLARTRRGWAPAQIEGTHVLLSARGGPAVLGLLRPSIVVPEWLRAEPAEAQRLILLHECEHLRARDHALLALAPLFVIAMPWNIALWWQLRRLRLAIEVDCDRRVLSRGVSPGSYGALLLDIARRGGPVLAGAAALAEPRTFLERRILAMSSSIPKLRLPRAIAFTAIAGVLALAACEAASPMNVNAPSPEPVGAVTAVEEPLEILPRSASGEPLIYVDGVRMEGGIAELDPNTIDRIEVIKGEAAARLYGPRGANGVIQIVTKDAGGEYEVLEVLGRDEVVALREKKVVEAALRRETEKEVAGVVRLREVLPKEIVVRGVERQNPTREKTVLRELEARELVKQARETENVIRMRERPSTAAGAPDLLFLIDGVVVDHVDLDRLSPKDIERIEVVKGAAAAALYGPRGANGVILITTKR